MMRVEPYRINSRIFYNRDCGVSRVDVLLSDTPKLIPGQYIDLVNGFELRYNPLGYGGLTVIDSDTKKLLNLCDGRSTVQEISRIDGRSLNVVLDEIHSLALGEVIEVSRDFTVNLHELVRDRLGSGTMSCWMHITNRCNLACSYCYIHKSMGDMSKQIAQQIINKTIDSCKTNGINKMNIKFAGGEPLLRFDLVKSIVSYARDVSGDIDVSFLLLTNGTLVTEQIARYIKEKDIRVGVSLDGMGTVNDNCRHYANGKGSFENVFRGLSVLKNADVNPSIMTTVSCQNYRDLSDLTKFLLDQGYRFRFSLERDCESGKPELLKNLSGLIESLNDCYDYVEDHLPELDFTTIHTFGDVHFGVPVRKSCSAGRNFFSVSHDGKIGVCGLGLSQSFSTIEECGDILADVRNNNPELANGCASCYSDCSCCYWRTSCAGGCPLQTKATYLRYDRSSPYCEVYKAILPRILRIKGLQMIRGSY